MANPLTLIMPIKKGADLIKLAQVLKDAQPEIDRALTSIGTVHYARFVLFDGSAPNLQPKIGGPGPFSLSVITSYDGEFDAYIQAFVNQIGDVFDALLAFVEGGNAVTPVARNVEAFTKFVGLNNASQHFPNNQNGLYNAYPCTVQQVLAADPCPGTPPISL